MVRAHRKRTSMKNRKIILAIGGAHVDRRGQVSGDFIAGASNPGSMGEEIGGGAFNALRAAVQRGAEGWLMSVRGGDAAGASVARAVEAAGIRDLSVTFLDRTTPSYTAILASDGDVIAALADMSLYELAFPKQMRRASLREAAKAADAILCDANLPSPALVALSTMAAPVPVHAIAISPAKAVRLIPVLARLSCLYLNTREAAALTGLAANSPPARIVAALRERGVARALVTRGVDPLVGFDEREAMTLTPPPADRVVDVTGAGDALAGATMAALTGGLPLREAMRHGVAAARLVVESAQAAPELGSAAFARALALVPEAAPLHLEADRREHHVA